MSKESLRRQAEHAWNNREQGNWRAKEFTGYSYPADKTGQQQFHGRDMWGNGVDRLRREAAKPRPAEAGDVSGLVTDTYLTVPKLLCWEGGGIMRLSVPSRKPLLDLPERGEITTFSKGAARRLRCALAQILNSAWTTAVLATLTYPVDDIDLSDWHVYKLHLDRFSKAFRREYPNGSAVWRLEFTERGFPHFHFVVFGIPNTEKALVDYRQWHQKTWFRVVGTGLEKHLRACGNAERVTCIEGARNYVAKYVSKQSAQCSGFTGRYWGRINADMLPLAPLVELKLSDYQAVLVARILRKVIEKQVNGRRWQKAIKECSRMEERGWSRVNVEYAGSLEGKKGDSVLLLGEKWDCRIHIQGKLRDVEASTAPRWHHYFPDGMTCREVVGEEEKCFVLSDQILPRSFKTPKKYRSKRNNSIAYLGDASLLYEQLGRHLRKSPERSLNTKFRTKHTDALRQAA